MVGPPNSPGATLKQRMDDEGSGKFWRQFSSEVITIAAVGVASGGVGLVAEGVAVGANATRFTIGAARFLATSASFTTLMGAAQGKLSPQQYAVDMAMFGVMSAAGRFAKLAGEFAPGGRFVKLMAAHATAVGASAGVVTGFNILDQLAKGRDPTWQSARDQFVRNLGMVTV